MKQCASCLKHKDDDEFNWRYTGVMRQSICRECQIGARRKHYEKYSEREIERTRERRLDARERARNFVFDYLSHHACVFCGEYRPEMLQFDHIRGTKKKAVSQQVQDGASIETIRKEIMLCEVVCANCHQMRERRRRGG